MFSEKQLSDWVKDDHIHNIAYLAFTGYVLLNWTSCTQHPQVNYKFLAVCVEYLLGCIKEYYYHFYFNQVCILARVTWIRNWFRWDI